MQYYIHHSTGQQGPFDLLGIIRKIRNGSLAKTDTLVPKGEDAPRPAYQYPELYDVFIEQDKIEQEFEAMQHGQNVSFIGLLKSGTATLKEDLTAAVITALLLLAVIIIVAAMSYGVPVLITAIAAPFLSYIMFNLALVAMMRVARVQLLSGRYVSETLRVYGVALLTVSAIPALIGFSIPWIVGHLVNPAAWALTLFVGIPIMAYFLYIPLLIVDRGLSLKAAFCQNHQIIRTLGMDLFALVIGLLCINILAAGLIVLPIVTLPITFISLIQLYDRQFYE